MRARNIIIILVVNYMILVVISGVLELHSLSNKAKEVQMVIRTAADTALQQTQLVDDFMGFNERDSIKLKFPARDGSGFVEKDMFEGTLGLDSTIDGNKEKIFSTLYDTNDFMMLSERLSPLRKPVKYWNANRTGFAWYYIPRASMMGLDILPSSDNVRGVKDADGNYVDDAFANEILAAYDLNSHIKYSGNEEYYNTPLNIGVTYLNEDLLGTLFMNNVDTLMRTKYRTNLNDEKGGNGVLKGTTYADKINGDLTSKNPINNGIFTVLRGEQISDVNSVKAFTGVKPLVLYRVIDMYDKKNDVMLERLFGANKGRFSSKAEYLKDADKNVLNPANNLPYTTKPIVVAKVTFYLDVLIPYYSIVARELRGSIGEGSSNFIELKPTAEDGADGTRRIAYTTFFAVTP